MLEIEIYIRVSSSIYDWHKYNDCGYSEYEASSELVEA